MNNYLNKLNSKINKRLLIIFIGICILFLILIIKLYYLQIINGEFLKNQVIGTTLKEVNISAPRGNIYDRYGRALAINTTSFTVNLDASTNIENINNVILNVINLLEENNENIVDEFPISKEKPYTFLFNDNKGQEERWKKNMNLDLSLSAADTFAYLRNFFDIDKNLSDEDARKILSIRTMLYEKRYSRFVPITIAYDVSQKTIGKIEENKTNFNGIYIDVEALRTYPLGKMFSHILGYIRGITQTELEEYKNYGYTQNDIIGKEGIEKAFELDLKGKDGKVYYEVDNLGRKVKEVKEKSLNPVAGNNIFLTVDKNLQEKIFNTVEDTLKETIINRLLGKNKAFNFSSKDVLKSMVKNNSISIKKIMSANENTYQGLVKKHILAKNAAANDINIAKEILAEEIERGAIYQSQILMCMFEQGIITGSSSYISSVRSGAISPTQVLIDKLNSKEITPHMTAMDPSTAFVIVTDVQTGDVLASVSYPSYDNNMFVNNFNNEYYISLQNDPTTPLVNRPFTEPRAPGSTFKMISAIAGLETGKITKDTKIYDEGTFKKAGLPYARCWTITTNGSHTHGYVNVSQALEVSCNYFFYELSYNLGNKDKSSIEVLNEYMKKFGLNDRTGVELYELYDSTTNYPSNISSPEYKQYITKLRNPDAKESELKWSEGDTIRTSIGQSYNNYTSASIAKYTSILANGGTRYALHFLNKITDNELNTLNEYESIIEDELNLNKQNLQAVHEGMLLVTSGSKGTLRNQFKNFPVKVAAKSGTAQQSSLRSEHTLFTGFAPYDDPQIAITVLIPYGNDTTSPATKIAKTIIEEYLGLNHQPEKTTYNTLTK